MSSCVAESMPLLHIQHCLLLIDMHLQPYCTVAPLCHTLQLMTGSLQIRTRIKAGFAEAPDAEASSSNSNNKDRMSHSAVESTSSAGCNSTGDSTTVSHSSSNGWGQSRPGGATRSNCSSGITTTTSSNTRGQCISHSNSKSSSSSSGSGNGSSGCHHGNSSSGVSSRAVGKSDNRAETGSKASAAATEAELRALFNSIDADGSGEPMRLKKGCAASHLHQQHSTAQLPSDTRRLLGYAYILLNGLVQQLNRPSVAHFCPRLPFCRCY